MAIQEPWPASSLTDSGMDDHCEEVVLREDDILNLVDRVSSGRNAWEELYNSAAAAREKREAIKLHGRFIMERIDASLSFTPKTGRAPKYSSATPPYWERLTRTTDGHTSGSRFHSPVTPRELFSRSATTRTPRSPAPNHSSVAISSKRIDAEKVVMRLQSPSTRKRTPKTKEPTYVPELYAKTLELTKMRSQQRKEDGGIHEILHKEASEIEAKKLKTEKTGNNSRGRQVGELKDVQQKPTLSKGTREIIDRKKKEVDFDSMTGRKGPVRRKRVESPKKAPSPPEVADTISVSLQSTTINTELDETTDHDDDEDDEEDDDDDEDSAEYHSTSDNDDSDSALSTIPSLGTPRALPIGSHVICSTGDKPILGVITHHNDDGHAYRISTKAGPLQAKLESYVKPAGKKVYVNTVAACGGGFGITCMGTRVTGISPYSAANGTIPMGATIMAVNETVVESEEDLHEVMSQLSGTQKATAFYIIPDVDTQWRNVPVKAPVPSGPQQPVIEGRQKTIPMSSPTAKGRTKDASPPGTTRQYKKSPGLSPFAKGAAGSMSSMSQASVPPAWSAKGPPPGPPGPRVQGSVKGGRVPSPVVQHRPGRPRSMDGTPESPRIQGGMKGSAPGGPGNVVADRPSPVMRPKKVPRPRLRR
eukprot:TRINITY_DN8700_c0_g1_i1.p1 TRINITY_DN8700_c0_g1~~TRINITY_DN8700_c0_g1_i1.p1  ORF type:complete len:647 (+),score=133.32 TRINITY_DN8700_c0_g1_i1:45-1985(+)